MRFGHWMREAGAMSHPMIVLLGLLAVLAGVAFSWYARFRFIANDPADSPFAGRRWRLFPPRRLFRSPGFAVFVVAEIIGLAGAVVLLVSLLG